MSANDGSVTITIVVDPDGTVTVGHAGTRVTVTVERVDGRNVPVCVRQEPAARPAQEGMRGGARPRDSERPRAGRTDAEVKEVIREALRAAPRGLGREDLARAAHVGIARACQLRAEMMQSGEAVWHKRKLWLAESDGLTRALSAWRRGRNAPVVYFMRAGEGLIKIGCTKRLRSRHASIQSASAEEVSIIAVIRGAGRAEERALHAQFAAERQHGEWFTPSERLLAWIQANASPWDDRRGSGQANDHEEGAPL